MTRRRRRTLIGVAAAAVAATVTASLLTTAPTASADVDGPYYATQANASDPHIIRCKAPGSTTEGYCLFTSLDMGQDFAYDGNHYPMRDTKLYYSHTGRADDWIFIRNVATEVGHYKSDGGWIANNAYHQWAPAAVKWGSRYYAYVPNVADKTVPAISQTSRIAVWRSAPDSPLGEYEYRSYITPVEGYMSDPEVFIDGSTRYLIWANGDNSTCGTFSMAEMVDYRTLVPRDATAIEIDGVEVLGDCDGSGPKTTPYMEGASLFQFNAPDMPGPYTLVFAVKPTSVPTECKSNVGGLNTANEAIAYATSQTVRGPYEYQGIIMCGSTTEWTNQATIMQMQAEHGSKPWVIVYHDADDGDDTKQRNLHAECLFTGGGRIAGVYRQPHDNKYGFNDCVEDGGYFAFSGLQVYDVEQPSKPPILSTPNAGGDPAVLNRYAVGDWERFKVFKKGNGNYVIQSLANKKYLCAHGVVTALEASCSSSTSLGAEFKRFNFADDAFQLQSVAFGTYVNVHSDGRLYLDSEALRGDTPAMFTEMHLR